MSEECTLIEINTQSLDDDLNSNFVELQTAIDTETNRAESAENTLKVNLSAFEAATQSALSLKADKTYVDSGLATKANLSGSPTQLFNVANATLATEALNKGQFDTGMTTKADLAGNQAQKFNVANAVQPSQAVNKGQLDSLSNGVSHTVAANTVLNVPSPYTDINAALNYLNGKTLLGYVTIQIADGPHAYSSPIIITHPQSELIIIQGSTSNRSAVTLNFTNCNGFSYASGKTLVLKNLTINGNDNTSTTGITCFGYAYIYNVVVSNFNDGITLRNGYIDLNTCLITSNVNNGINVYGGAYCGMVNCSFTYNICGVYIGASSQVDANDSVSLTNNTYGFNVDACSYLHVGSTCTISANTAYAIAANRNSIVYAVGASISGTLSPAANTDGNINSYISV